MTNQKDLSPKIQLLMSANNPNGWKLEEILQQIAGELEVKNEILKQAKRTKASLRISRNNESIIAELKQCVKCQLSTLEILDDIGPDQGPYGVKRI